MGDSWLPRTVGVGASDPTRLENKAGNYPSGGNFYSIKEVRKSLNRYLINEPFLRSLWPARESQKDRLRSDINENCPDIPWRNKREADDGIRPWLSQFTNSGSSYNEPPRGCSVQRKELFGRHEAMIKTN
ncbi:hypothetical protein G9A89_010081 [Geosiphon pyriformis]|nr:hypothetical protein G9A89_010081 [Geosiphon pyriformis]